MFMQKWKEGKLKEHIRAEKALEACSYVNQAFIKSAKMRKKED